MRKVDAFLITTKAPVVCFAIALLVILIGLLISRSVSDGAGFALTILGFVFYVACFARALLVGPGRLMYAAGPQGQPLVAPRDPCQECRLESALMLYNGLRRCEFCIRIAISRRRRDEASRAVLASLPGCAECTNQDGDSDGTVSFRIADGPGEFESVPCECPKGQALAAEIAARSGVRR